ncbi:MAG: aminotransferase class III-fold pyridoxal phosphate-dependent enzyme [Anaerolineae bacterium]
MSLSLDARRGRPRFSEADVCRIAWDLYGLRVTARELPSERDQNFHLHDEAGRMFVLKLSGAAEKRETLEAQNQAMARIHSAVPCPRIWPTTTGESIAVVTGGDGRQRFLRLLTYLPGTPLVEINPHSPELLKNIGRFLGKMSRALNGFSHPGANRIFKWDLKHAAEVIRRHLTYITDPAQLAVVTHFLTQFETAVVPVLPTLRTSVIHGDGNDYNLLADGEQVCGIIDFGDLVHSHTVFDLAIALAYMMLDKDDPVAAAAHVVSGYHAVYPLTELELEHLFTLACVRLCVSVAVSAKQQKMEPDLPYLSVTEAPAWALLARFTGLAPTLPHYIFRHACGLPPCPNGRRVTQWLGHNREQLAPVVAPGESAPGEEAPDLRRDRSLVFDLSVGSLDLAELPDLADTEALARLLAWRMKAEGVTVGIGRYDEARLIYRGDQFKSELSGEQRTIHLGMDLFMEAGTPIFAPLAGTVHSFADNAAPLNYGPTVLLRHEPAAELFFYTLYGHLSAESLDGLFEGMPVEQGAQIGQIGEAAVNGSWPPHLHFQIIADLLGRSGEFPGVAAPGERAVWLSICPDPNLILGIPEDAFLPAGMSKADILSARRDSIGRSLSIAYRQPLHIVRGEGQYLYDEMGRAYLDAVNNVCHVGHCHPRVVEALRRQAAVLNTNTRYLHENLVRYARRLCATLPDPLSVCFFVCTGSEANDLALRLARTHTGRQDVITVDAAYHGNLASLIAISPYKHDGPGGSGAPPHVQKVMMPDGYRGAYKMSDPRAGKKYARHVQEAVERIQTQGRGVAAFICESLMGCGGQIVLPDGYLQAAYEHVRAGGGVCIADEVQVGFARVGSHFWGFETQGVAPDIVTMGKPMGNGHPLAAVVTTREIAASFDNGMEYFNTFGGNPVSCAVGMAVLDVIEQEQLQAHALTVGAHLKAGLSRLMDRHPLIGDVRGLGLFIGVELVQDQETLAPAASQAAYIVERMKALGILLSIDGPLHNVLKLKPPLVFTRENADCLVQVLDRVLAEDGAQPGGGRNSGE